MAFTGFTQDTLDFLAELYEVNTSEWFAANRPRYEAALAEAREFVVAAGAVLARIEPAVVAEPRVNGSILRINRDIRFSPDKRPYKGHLDFWFWEGERRDAVGGFYARVAPDGFALGAGVYRFDAGQLRRFREAVVDPVSGPELNRLAGRIERKGIELDGEHYKRTPRGFDDSVPAARFLRHDTLRAFVPLPADTALQRTPLMSQCRSVWRSLAPMQRWLEDHVAG